MASWLVRSSPERAVRVRALARDIVLCSWARHLTLTLNSLGVKRRPDGPTWPECRLYLTFYLLLLLLLFQLKNITLYFFSLVCSSFSRYYVCKQPSVFQAASFGDLLLNKKQKKSFVSLKDEVTITQSFFIAASLAQVDNAPNKADSDFFCHDTQGLDSRSVKSFFFVLFFFFFQKPSSCLCN